jgi:Fur family zinc uptake transcriptional regulator
MNMRFFPSQIVTVYLILDMIISNALAVAEHLCAGRRVKLTPIRRKALELIWKSHRAVKANDLLDQMKPMQHPPNLQLSTVPWIFSWSKA